jgi:phosphoserine phosphatase RsbU/P
MTDDDIAHTRRTPIAQFGPDIASLPLFRRAEERLILDALSTCEVLALPAGTPLLKPGESNQNVYIPLSGQVVVHLDVDLNPDRAIPIALGECVGELSAIDGKPVSGLVKTVTEAHVLRIPQEVFWNRLMTLPGVAASFMVLLSERLRRSTEHALKAQSEQLELMHLRKELNVARQLQTSMLPLQRPLFPGRHDIEVCGFMEPASRVGGDLFDAFFVRDRQLFFCIGDVSGHGIASALFMARTIGLLRILAMTTFQPDKLLKKMNDRLCVNNDTNLFVTLFCGFLDVDSGRLVYSNGGHCAPILSSGGQVRELPIPKGPLIGAFPGVSYSSMEQVLNPDDVLYCYTDGVTEAQNTSGEEFTESRCQDLIGQSGKQSLQVVLDSIRRRVADFTGTEILEDDFTMLALRRTALAPS